jgi:hypothetical protein
MSRQIRHASETSSQIWSEPDTSDVDGEVDAEPLGRPFRAELPAACAIA